MSTSVELYPTQQMIASSAGALLVALITTPLDVVKVRLQAQLKTESVRCSVFKELVSVCYCANPPLFNSPVLCTIHGNIHTVPRFSSTMDAFFKIAKFEGFATLWKGLSPYLVQMVPQTVIYFTAYDQLKVKFGYVEGKASVIAPLSAGVTARTFAVVAMSPIEMLRTKLQSKKNLGYRELVKNLQTTINGEGIFCLWKGIGPTLFRDVPFSGFYWLFYELLKSNNPSPTLFSTFLSGAISGMFAAGLTTPFDVVKTYRQIELGEIKNGKHVSRFTFAVMIRLYKTKGFSSLFTGLYPRLMKVSLSCAVMISTYEYGKKYFANRNLLSLKEV
uniref:Solute carrier family 25 member 40 n=1 Tax=Hydra vulgaris TaxID=6087 RepID=T2M9G7_HYDVU